MDSSSALLHRLNGQLLKCLNEKLLPCLLADPDWRWDSKSWIINVIILHRSIEGIEEAEMRTSATLYLGDIVDGRRTLESTKGVTELDGHVPLDKSLSGYCIRTGNLVWIDRMDSLEESDHPLRDYYRPFEYVGVHPKTRPRAEYVFPIRIRVGTSEALLGVLNMEWFSEDSLEQNQFLASGQRDAVTDAILNLLDVHGPFLVVSMLPEAAQGSTAAQDSLEAAHWEVLVRHFDDFSARRPKPVESELAYENV
jgi:hypothetical protein